MKDYSEVLDYLYSQLPMYQRSGPAAYKNTLGNTHELDKMFVSPHKNFKSIHIGGTNGKGSVSHMLTSILQEAGYKTGLYTSPHLKDFRERIKVNGEMIGEIDVVEFVTNFRKKNNNTQLQPSFFELTVAMAFDYFSKQQVDIAIVEVGLGGRLDSTNIINPEVSVITNISLDHTALLGNTLSLIAAEKAGIIKKDVPVIIGESSDEYDYIFIEKATEVQTYISFADKHYHSSYSMMTPDGFQLVNMHYKDELIYPNLKSDLLGNYQRKNIATTLQTIDQLTNKGWQIQNEHIYVGLQKVKANTGLLGRWQIIGNNPLIVCDAGHNEAGIKEIIQQINNTAYKNLHFVLGMVQDKNLDAVLQLLPNKATYYFCQANIDRALDAAKLKELASKFDLKGDFFSDVNMALDKAKSAADEHDMIFIGGSTFVIAEVL